MSFCQQCGNKVEANSSFCSSCGYSLKEEVPTDSHEIEKTPVSYRVVIEGKCLAGFESSKVHKDFARLIRQSDAIAANLLVSSESTIKTGIDKVTGDHYLNTLRQIGVACRMEEESTFLDVDLPPCAQPETSVKVSATTTIQTTPEPSVAADAPDENWYYGIAERQFGPLSTSKMVDFINKRIIGENTLVKPESGDWTTAINSKLSTHFTQIAVASPNKEINNIFVWCLAVTPIVGAITESILRIGANNQFLVIFAYFIANTVFCILDVKHLKSDGHQAPNVAWLLLIPVYLWQRASFLKQSPHYFWVWIVAFILSIFINA